MRKIKWKPNSKYSKTIYARIGSVYMSCIPIKTKANTTWWRAGISIKHIILIPLGPTRKSLSKAKEDAIMMASRALLDYRAGLDRELKNFDLLEV